MGRDIARGIEGLLRGLARIASGSSLILVGGAAITYGAYEIYRPAGPITGGILLIVGTVLNENGKGA